MPGHAAYPVKPGFSDPVYEAQRVFQLLQEAMATPGLPVELDPVPIVTPLNAASMAICLAMLDMETPLWLDPGARLQRLEQHLDHHCECPLVDNPAEARYALACNPLSAPLLSACGSVVEHNEEGTVLIIQVPALDGVDAPVAVTTTQGTPKPLSIGGLADDFWQQPGLIGNGPARQVDLIFTHANQLIALPRFARLILS